MVEIHSNSPLPDTHANDEEIKRYGVLLDQLGIGMLVYAADALPCLKNRRAGELLGEIDQPQWFDENGQTITFNDLPLQRTLNTSEPVFDRFMAVADHRGKTISFSVNTLPILSENGTIRRVLLTLADISEYRNSKDAIERLSIHDPLTGLFNQRQVIQLLENEIHRARRYGTPFTLAQIDVDLFHPLCRQHGMLTGETILADIGRLISDSMREIDFAGRTGNDDFLLVMPNVSVKNALVGLERLRALIETHHFTEAELRVSISGGITEFTGETSEALMERSKSLMLQAQESGGNRYCLDADII